jgi:hypothetical protein
MWLDRNQFPVKESLVFWFPTGSQVNNQLCLTGLHLPWVPPLRLTSLGNHYLGMRSTVDQHSWPWPWHPIQQRHNCSENFLVISFFLCYCFCLFVYLCLGLIPLSCTATWHKMRLRGLFSNPHILTNG